MKTTGTMRAGADQRGSVRVEDTFDTDIDDLWEACTTAERLSRWIAVELSGDLVVGGLVTTTFTSSWSGSTRIDACDRPHHLLVTMDPGTDDETQVEAWLTADGPRTRLVVEERGLPVDKLHFYGAGWQAHLEDLAGALDERPPEWMQRWTRLTPGYASQPVEPAAR